VLVDVSLVVAGLEALLVEDEEEFPVLFEDCAAACCCANTASSSLLRDPQLRQQNPRTHVAPRTITGALGKKNLEKTVFSRGKIMGNVF